jgi:2-oxo-hept-3-ene-1,7-dioate hydratase
MKNAAVALLRAKRERKQIPRLSRTFPNMEIEDACRIQDLWAGHRQVGAAVGGLVKGGMPCS